MRADTEKGKENETHRERDRDKKWEREIKREERVREKKGGRGGERERGRERNRGETAEIPDSGFRVPGSHKALCVNQNKFFSHWRATSLCVQAFSTGLHLDMN